MVFGQVDANLRYADTCQHTNIKKNKQATTIS